MSDREIRHVRSPITCGWDGVNAHSCTWCGRASHGFAWYCYTKLCWPRIFVTGYVIDQHTIGPYKPRADMAIGSAQSVWPCTSHMWLLSLRADVHWDTQYDACGFAIRVH